MILTRHAKRILGAAILLVALALMPSLAQAHSGHAHHAAATVVVQHDDEGTLAPVPGDHADAAVDASNATAATDLAACLDGCCTGTHCSACFGMALLSDRDARPAVGTSALAVPETPASPGFSPARLRKPPRSLA